MGGGGEVGKEVGRGRRKGGRISVDGGVIEAATTTTTVRGGTSKGTVDVPGGGGIFFPLTPPPQCETGEGELDGRGLKWRGLGRERGGIAGGCREPPPTPTPTTALDPSVRGGGWLVKMMVLVVTTPTQKGVMVGAVGWAQ